MSRFPIIVCDDDEDLANQLAKNINASIQNLTDDNESYTKLMNVLHSLLIILLKQ